MHNQKILIVGSIGRDVIFSVKGKINDNIHIKNGVLGMQSMMFTAGDKKEFYGGVGANISYGAGILGAKPTLFSLTGKDFEGDFKNHLKKSGVDLKVIVDKKGFTADFYGITDDVGEQIGIWQPNAYSKIEKIKIADAISASELKKFGIAIFSPGSPKSILKHMQEFKKHANQEATMIFDPGQVIAYFSKQDFLKCLDLCDIFISNEVEMKQAEKMIGQKVSDVLNCLGKTAIETKSKEGSIIYAPLDILKVPAVKPKKVLDSTGAGDAYRAGLLAGISKGMPLEEACFLGAKMATSSLEHLGAQGYPKKA